MPEYSDSFEEETHRRHVATPEEMQNAVEDRLSDPAFLEYARAAVKKRESKNLDEYLKDADNAEILDLSTEYETNVLPLINKFKDFFGENFFNKFASVIKKKKASGSTPAEDYLGDAKKSIDVYLAKQAVEDPVKFSEYENKFRIYDGLQATAKTLNEELMQKYRTIKKEEIDGFKWQADQNVSRGNELLAENESKLDGAIREIKGKKWYTREGAAIRWSRFKNSIKTVFGLFGSSGSDAENEEVAAHNQAAARIRESIEAWQAKSDTAARDAEIQESITKEITVARMDLLEALDASQDIRRLLMEGLDEAMKRGNYNVAGMGEAIGAIDEEWGEFGDSFNTKKEYRDDRKKIAELLKDAFAKVLEEQKKSAEKSVNPGKLQEFGQFIDSSINSEETKKVAEDALKKSIAEVKKIEPNSPKLAHLTLMMRRLAAKTF